MLLFNHRSDLKLFVATKFSFCISLEKSCQKDGKRNK